MTKKEAVDSMETYRVRHKSHPKGYWITLCESGYFHDSNNKMFDHEEFRMTYFMHMYAEGWERVSNN